MQVFSQEIKLTSERIKSLINDSENCATAVNLIFVKTSEPGIVRVKKGKGFSYLFQNRKVTDKNLLDRIKNLVIPPAWRDVWICAKENGHLQATGYDIKNRKQYRYHQLWCVLRNQTKFYRLQEFGQTLPSVREQLEKDLALPGLPRRKVLALVVSLMELTHIRIGNQMYEKLYGSYGLTTLKDQHVKFGKDELRFIFKGKKGVNHSVSLKNKRFAALVKKCRDIPGKELFQYLDEYGVRHCIDSGMVNDYIKEISGSEFTAKDFRTWAGTTAALIELKKHEKKKSAVKKTVVSVLDEVAMQLGNTRSVCKKYYVLPLVFELYESGKLDPYLNQINGSKKINTMAMLSDEEKVLLKILKTEFKQIKI